MSLYKKYETDTKAEVEGIELDFGDGVIFKVARAGKSNPAFSKASRKRTKPYLFAIKAGTLSDEVATTVLINVYADSVVLGWEGVTDKEGESLEYSRENVVKLLTDLPDLLEQIKEYSEDSDSFNAATHGGVAETLGNI
tara:strand:- start:41 stop:457 length:417 start_codon:yes stop_codon:yes gene_type:complete